MTSPDASLPSAALLAQQARWLAPARAALLRRAAIAHCRSVLDLGAGRGMVSGELQRRSSGRVYALDRSAGALYEAKSRPTLLRIVGDAGNLPFSNGQMDLVFCQFTLLWTGQLSRCVAEIWRVLAPGGHFCAIEPDYAGLIEYPQQTSIRAIWLAALGRSGAIPDVGRRLPDLLERQGFRLKVRLLDQLQPPSPLRFAMLRELPLTSEESARALTAEETAQALNGWQQISHLPLFLIDAVRPE